MKKGKLALALSLAAIPSPGQSRSPDKDMISCSKLTNTL